MGVTSRLIRRLCGGPADLDIYVMVEVDGRKVSKRTIARRMSRAVAPYAPFSSLPDEKHGVWRGVPMDPLKHVTEHRLDTNAQTPEAAMLRFVEVQMAKPMPSDRPPWEVCSLHHDGPEPNYLLIRCDHAIADGPILTAILARAADQENSPRPEAQPCTAARDKAPPATSTIANTNTLTSAAALVCMVLLCARSGKCDLVAFLAGVAIMLLSRNRNAVTALRRIAFTGGHRKTSPWPRPMPGQDQTETKRVAKTRPLPLSAIKNLGATAGVGQRATVNDVMLGLICGAAGRYAAHHDREVGDTLEIMSVAGTAKGSPQTLLERYLGGARENAVGFRPVGIPFCHSDDSPTARVRGAQKTMLCAKRSGPLGAHGLAAILIGALEAAGLGAAAGGLIRMFGVRLADAYVSNTRSLTEVRTFRGRKIKTVYNWVGSWELGVNFTMLSCYDSITVCCCAADACVPDPDFLVGCIEAEFDALVTECK